MPSTSPALLRGTIVLLLVLWTSAKGQAQQVCTPDSLVDFLDADLVKVAPGNKARFTRVKSFTSVEGGIIATYYPGGQLRSLVNYSDLRNYKRQGPAFDRYPSGRLKLAYDADDGQINGYLLSYYPDGTLKRKDLYDHGQLVKGQYFGPDGQLIEPYVPYQQNPVFPSGTLALMAAIQQHLEYPPGAVRSAAEGQVMVHFVVTARGEVTAVQVPHPNNLLLDAAAVQAVRQLPPFEPGRVDGDRVPIPMLVPITFRASATMKTLKRLGF